MGEASGGITVVVEDLGFGSGAGMDRPAELTWLPVAHGLIHPVPLSHALQ